MSTFSRLTKLIAYPRLYAMFLFWMLSELFERLPEVGDPDRPKLVFFFDEAHLLFNDAAQATPGKDRAGRALDPFQGGGRLFRHANPPRRAGARPRTARQPRAARAASVYAARPGGGEGGGRHVPPQSYARHRQGDHGARRGRGAGLFPRRQRRSLRGRAHDDP